MLASTIDPEGRRVVLFEDRWLHIKDGHPMLASRMREIMAAVREPTQRFPGRIDAEEWYFASEALPGMWLQVVVHYEGGEGWIVTAFPRDFPRASPRRR